MQPTPASLKPRVIYAVKIEIVEDTGEIARRGAAAVAYQATLTVEDNRTAEERRTAHTLPGDLHLRGALERALATLADLVP